MPRIIPPFVPLVLCLAISLAVLPERFFPLAAQDADRISPLDGDGKLVQFSRDLVPLLAARCAQCHRGENPKGDFRIDDPEHVMRYVTPGDVEGSALYSDYLRSDDPELLMPPASHGGPLQPAELALVRTWIEEGASWPAEVIFPADGTDPGNEKASAQGTQLTTTVPSTWPARIWAFQGYFHPAVVHFPIALLTMGALFVLIGLVWTKLGTQIPLACLLLGSVSAVVASCMGWSLASEQGYPGFAAGLDKEVNSHRLSGIVVALLAVGLAVVAIFGVWKGRRGWNFVWKTGLLVLAGLVGLVGHQGGELTYGTEYYQRAFARLGWNDPMTEAIPAASSGSSPGSESAAEGSSTTGE